MGTRLQKLACMRVNPITAGFSACFFYAANAAERKYMSQFHDHYSKTANSASDGSLTRDFFYEEEPVTWMTDRGLDEVLFCRELLEEHPMVCVGGAFIGLDGMMADHAVKRLIYTKLSPHIRKGLSRLTDQLLNTLSMEAYREEITPSLTKIHVANGTYSLAGIPSA